MVIFETILALLLAASVLSMIARAIAIPYPTLLALGGAALACVPSGPRLNFPPDLLLALFVAPVLLDAAHDTSLRDLKQNWRPVSSLVILAVGLTTICVAAACHWLIPQMPLGAAIALGALVAPPDAVAALAVMRHVKPPHKIRAILEGESLLNDASALLIYKLAVTAVAVGGFSFSSVGPAFVLVIFGSILVGWMLAQAAMLITPRIDDPPISTVIQFVTTFGVWLLAERLELSGVMTIVVFGITVGRRSEGIAAARVRVSSFATWDTVTFVLNVLAFTLIGLQLRPVLEAIGPKDLRADMGIAIAILGLVIAVRMLWIVIHALTARFSHAPEERSGTGLDTLKTAFVIGWSGMRGIVTLAAALALPEKFPYRNFILLTAFTVVLGTLVIQGLTLRPLLALFKLPDDDPVQAELALARGVALKAAMRELKQNDEPAAARLKTEYYAAFSEAREGRNPHGSRENVLRTETLPHSRRAIAELRKNGTIGDEAYRQVEMELDWLEMSASA